MRLPIVAALITYSVCVCFLNHVMTLTYYVIISLHAYLHIHMHNLLLKNAIYYTE